MQLKKVVFVSRKKGTGKSIEGVFEGVRKRLSELGFEVSSIEVPHSGTNPVKMLKNLLFVARIKGIVHVTGDVHYVCINPFLRSVLTVHDVGLLQHGNVFVRFTKKMLWFWLPSIFTRKITTVSDFTKTELLKVIPWAASKIIVVPNPVIPQFSFRKKTFDKSKPVILIVGTQENKNIDRTLKSLEKIPCKIEIVGSLSDDQKQLLNSLRLDYSNHVNVPLSHIIDLYNAADIVSFISNYEGFGLPVIEAQKTGVVVITSRCTSIPEVAADGALYVSNVDIDDIRNGFLRLINDDALREHLILRGQENVKRFDISELANNYYKLYQSLPGKQN